jgi:hypothetical protein
MLEDPEGKTYIITPGEIVGREHATVSRILNTGVVLTERTFNYLGQESLYEKVLSLPQSGSDNIMDLGAKPIRPQGRNGTPQGANVPFFNGAENEAIGLGAPAIPGGTQPGFMDRGVAGQNKFAPPENTSGAAETSTQPKQNGDGNPAPASDGGLLVPPQGGGNLLVNPAGSGGAPSAGNANGAESAPAAPQSITNKNPGGLVY